MTFNKNVTSAIALVLFTVAAVTAQKTIPFQLGKDNRIYIDVKLNDHPLKFVFDTGASGMVANTTQLDRKLDIDYNHEVENMGANGSSMQRLSQGNTIQVGSIIKDNQELIGIAYPEEYYDFDGVIGYPFFDKHFIEIDYEKCKLIIHKSKKTLPKLTEFEKHDLQLLGGVPFMDISIFSNTEEISFPTLIDTGFNGELIVYHNVVATHDLNSKYKSLKRSESEGTDGNVIYSDQVIIPKAKLGSTILKDLPAYLNRSGAPSQFPSILGGEVLKQFHWILHIRKGVVYLKPN